MRKAPDAFRTISEASDALQTPAHVLRFWESKFSQIKPVKRAGGRRYYRPADINLLSGIKTLLHDQGMTIRGVQKLLVEKGVRHVAQIAVVTDLGDEVLEAQAEILDMNQNPASDAHFIDEGADTPDVVEAAHIDLGPATETAPQTEPLPEPAPSKLTPEAEAEAEAEENALPASSVQPSPAEPAPVLPFPVPPEQTPETDSGPRNAFANLNTPKRRARLRPAALAHALRTKPPTPAQIQQAAPLVAKLEALLTRMQKTD